MNPPPPNCPPGEPGSDLELSTRWRLVLGRYARDRLPVPLPAAAARMEAALDFLYAREYRGRGVRHRAPAGTLDPTQLTVPTWLQEVRELFPRDTIEVIEKHALDRYGLQELLTDPETLASLEPNFDLLKTLLTFRGLLHGEILAIARRLIRQVTDDLKRRLEPDVRRALAGRLSRFQHSPLRSARNFDWRGTLRRSLRHFDPERRRLALVDPRFFAANTRHLPWTLILCVDQSGSMADSVIHSAVLAGILAGLPLLRLRFLVFDTNVVDLSQHVDDAVELLLSVQLGGGTDIGQALRYAETLIDNPHRTIVSLVSDFCEGGSPAALLAACRRLRESGVRLLGLAALDAQASPAYDHATADQLAEAGMEIAALTPNRFASWLARVIHSR